MKKVIRLDEPKEEKQPKPIEFTGVLSAKGWGDAQDKSLNEVENITYLGKCQVDGDMFSVKYAHGTIVIYRGHLNDGVY